MMLYEAFSDPLPDFPEAPGWKAPTPFSLGSSNPATNVTCPPACWLEVHVNHYLQIAKRELAKPAVKDYLQGCAYPEMDPLLKLRCEADVVRYGNEQLILSVNQALRAILGDGRIECYSEFEFDNCRPDTAWVMAGSGDELDSKNSFALLEAKIQGAIRPDQFGPTKITREQDLPGAFESAAGNSKRTHFIGNSERIMSQVAKYARNVAFNTNYVALFDSGFLFLGIFSLDEKDTYFMKGTLIPCQGSASKDARKALLGWLVEAWENKLAGRNRRSAKHSIDGGNHDTRTGKLKETIDSSRNGPKVMVTPQSTDTPAPTSSLTESLGKTRSATKATKEATTGSASTGSASTGSASTASAAKVKAAKSKDTSGTSSISLRPRKK
jgi:hypothetical protein